MCPKCRAPHTASNGTYRFTNLTKGNANLSATACGYHESRDGLALDGAETLDFKLKTGGLWKKGGTGDNVFSISSSVEQVKITADYSEESSNFIVEGAGLFVNELVGTFWDQPHFSGTYLTTGGQVEITNSSGVAWTFTQVCP